MRLSTLVATTVDKPNGPTTATFTRAGGYVGRARNFRRLAAAQKALWRSENHRGRRPAVWTRGECLVVD